MKLSTRSRYGLRAICYMAENEDRGYIPVSEISEQLSLSENYLEQLIRILRKEKIVKSIRGPKGGYKLIKNPSEITVGEVLRVLEGDFSISGCFENKDHCDNKCNAFFADFTMHDGILRNAEGLCSCLSRSFCIKVERELDIMKPKHVRHT